MIVSTVIDGITFYNESHVKWLSRRSWWDGFLAGCCVTCFSLGVMFVIIMGH